MVAEKLMIGDKVLVKVLSQIPGTYIVHTWTAEDYFRDLLQVKPIELTPEILELNGWKMKNHIKIYEYQVNNVEMSFGARLYVYVSTIEVDDKYNSIWIENYQLPIPKYVHELQRALRMFGLNDMADNFKVRKEIEQ